MAIEPWPRIFLEEPEASAGASPGSDVAAACQVREDGLLDHLIRPLQERRRHREAEGLGGLEVDDQVEYGRFLDR